MEAVFVLSLGSSDGNDNIYTELHDQLGAFVETGVIETEINVDNQGD